MPSRLGGSEILMTELRTSCIRSWAMPSSETPMKVGDKPGPASTQVGVGDLDNAESGHARHGSDEP